MNIFVLFGVSGVFGIKAADVRADTGVCPYRRMNKQKCHVNLLQEILETFLRKYLVVCGLFCNFAVAMRGMKDLRFASHGRTGGRGGWAQNSDAPDNVESGLMKGETNHANILHTLSGQS